LYYAKTAITTLVLLGSVLVFAGPALSVPAGSCSIRAAKRDVAHAQRVVHRAQRHLAETRKVAQATALYSTFYGESVGRWVRAARRVGWRWSDIPTLMLVIRTESGGDPNAFSGYYAGLMQFGPDWWAGKWNPYHGPTNLHHGKHAHDANGWAPWGWLGR
jgi:hypothetical protein